MQETVQTTANQSAHPAAQVIAIQNRKFVCGLTWKSLSSPRDVMTEVREIGKKEHCDLAVIRRGVIIQAGFANQHAGVEKGALSLAAALAGQLGNTWLGAFAIPDHPDQYAVIAVHEGAILPGYDLMGSRDKALKELHYANRLLQLAPDKIFAPASLGFAPAQQEKQLIDLLSPRAIKTEYRLKPIFLKVNRYQAFSIGGIAAVAIVGAIGFNSYSQHQQKLAREQQIRAQLLAEQTQRKMAAPVEAVHPWISQPKAKDFILACNTAIDQIPLSMGGWLFTSANCQANTLSVEFKRPAHGTTVLQFAQTALKHFTQAPTFSEDGNTAHLIQPIPMSPGGDDALEAANLVLPTFKSHFQASDTPLTLKEITLATPAPSKGQPAMLPPSWRQFTFSFASALSPNSFLSALPKTGTRITTIKVTLDANAMLIWTTSGELYAKK